MEPADVNSEQVMPKQQYGDQGVWPRVGGK